MFTKVEINVNAKSSLTQSRIKSDSVNQHVGPKSTLQ